MIFGMAPSFEDILTSVAEIERVINGRQGVSDGADTSSNG
jgi:hypothetical protein